jgi:signal peptidase I
MAAQGLRIASSGIRLAWLAGVVGLLIIVCLPHLLPLVGGQMYVVRGGSMQPTIPLGAVVITESIDPTQIIPGDVITFRVPSGSIVTHRVVGINDVAERSFFTRGDANAATDPALVMGSSIIGRVTLSVPTAGTVLVAMASTFGTLAVLGILCSLLLAGWFLDELAATLSPVPPRRAAAGAIR